MLSAMVKVELFGVARVRAGASEIEVEAATLGEAFVQLAARFPALVPSVLEGGRLAATFAVALNGQTFTADAELQLADGDTLVVISANAGG
ncbi:MAG: MoaD/ThiS family protein [Myxococcales bacterium]|nr:MoaD/ThiS family protein [Myxococcales bacterium]